MNEDMIIGGIIGFFIAVLLIASGGLLVLTGWDISEDCNCGAITQEADFTIEGKKQFDGAGFGNGKFNVKLRNNEDQAANFKINMICNTAKDSNVISSNEMYVQPNEVKEFQIVYDVGILENWKCVLSSVKAEVITSCGEIN